MVKIPVFGLIYKRLVILIDRSSKESRESCVIALKEEIARGQSILIFPEGTMNRMEQLLGNFLMALLELPLKLKLQFCL